MVATKEISVFCSKTRKGKREKEQEDIILALKILNQYDSWGKNWNLKGIFVWVYIMVGKVHIVERTQDMRCIQ